MLVYYFVPFIVSNRYLLFWVSNGHNSVTVQNRTNVYMKFFHHKDLGNHLLQLCPKVVKHPVYKIVLVKDFRKIQNHKEMTISAACTCCWTVGRASEWPSTMFNSRSGVARVWTDQALNCALLSYYAASSGNSLPAFRGQHIGSIFKGQGEFLTFVDGTDILSRNVGKEVPLLAA